MGWHMQQRAAHRNPPRAFERHPPTLPLFAGAQLPRLLCLGPSSWSYQVARLRRPWQRRRSYWAGRRQLPPRSFSLAPGKVATHGGRSWRLEEGNARLWQAPGARALPFDLCCLMLCIADVLTRSAYTAYLLSLRGSLTEVKTTTILNF